MRAARILSVLLTAGLLAAAGWVLFSHESPAPLPSAQTVLAQDRAETTTPLAPGERPVAYLTIPALGLREVPIYDRGLDAEHRMQVAAGYSVTHYTGAGQIGTVSNVVLYGHDDIQGSVFRYLPKLQPSNAVYVTLPNGTTFPYAVVSVHFVSPKDVGILQPTAAPQLTLFSCYPYQVDNERVVVVATPA